MCVTSARAVLAQTIVYAGLARRQGRDVHVMGYQNRAENLADGANCMLLHLPSARPMSPDNMVDTSACPTVLEDLAKACQPATFSASRSMPAPAVHVFHKGIYTVVLANRAQLAVQALDQVPPARRPAISAALLEFYERWFPGWHVALCCFANHDAQVANPLLWWYEPLHPDVLMMPAIDCHTGDVPNLGARVQRDHQLIMGTNIQPKDAPSRFNQLCIPSADPGLPGDVHELMPTRADLSVRRGLGPNGDFLVDVASLMQGRPDVRVGRL